MSDLSAYIHVPFCRRKCNYCDFYSAPSDSGAVSSYAQSLVNQIRSSTEKGRGLKTVYFGGGTPSLLSESDFSLIVSALREAFDLSVCEEFTVECNPESVTPSLAAGWRKCGVNRISMGVQTFHDQHLKTLGRLHTAHRAKVAYEELRKAEFTNISLDLMAALPGQTEDEFRSDLETMIALAPEHLSVYLLKVEPNSAFGRGGVAEADEEIQRRMYLLADGLLAEAGYEHYEISNFARPGYRALHNSVYWNGGEYLAFGPGASGFLKGIRYHIPADTAEFCRCSGMVDPIVDEEINLAESRREAVFLGLRLSDGIDRSLIPREKDSFVRALCQMGLGVLSSDKFALTPEGFLVSDYVISELLPER